MPRPKPKTPWSSSMYCFRVTVEQRMRIAHLAKKEGLTAAAWLRKQIDKGDLT